MNKNNLQANHRLLTGVFFRFLFPTVLAAAAMQLVFVIGSMIVGHTLGSDHLAAMNLAMPFVQVLVACGVFFGIGGSVLIATYKGEHHYERCSEVFTLSLAGMLLGGIAIAGFGLLFHERIVFILAGNATELMHDVDEFLFPMLLAAPLVVLTVGMAYPIRTDGNPNLSSGLLLVANILNIVLVPVFIPLLGNLSAYGWAMFVGYACSTLGLYRYIVWPDRTLRWVWPRSVLGDLARLVFNGLPVASTGLMVPIMIYCINRTAVHYAGTQGLTICTIVMANILVISLVIAGTVQTMMPMTGILFGEKDWNGLRYVFRLSFWTVASFAIVLILFLEMMPGIVLRLFGISDGELCTLGIDSLRIFAPAVGGIAIVGLLRSYTQAIGRPVLAFSLVFVENLGAMLPSIWFLSHLWGYSGIWYGYVLAEYSALIYYFICAACILYLNRSLKGFLLLPLSDRWQDRIFELSIDRKHEIDPETVRTVLADFFDRQPFIGDPREKMLRSIEESIRFIFEKGSTRQIDLRIEYDSARTVASLRFDGSLSDNIPPPTDPTVQMEISPQFGLNHWQVVVTSY